MSIGAVSSCMLRFGLSMFAVAILFEVQSCATASAQQPARQKATGVVFHDLNKNGVFDAADHAFKGIKVSNGREIVKTDQRGRYELPVDDDTIIFVIKPQGFRTPLTPDKLPKFYYVHKPKGSPASRFEGVKPTGELPASIDFPLYQQDEPNQFEVLMFGDPQARNVKEVDYVARDVVTELVGSKAAFGVTLGDIVFDDLNMLEPHNRAVALIGIPWYNVIGNHDLNLDSPDRKNLNETFERYYGPSYYSFDYGHVHFVVLDNIDWHIPADKDKPQYRGGFGKEQLEFVKNDLAAIPENQMVVMLMHIPLNGVSDRQEMYRLIEKRPLCISLSGHTHTHEHRFIGAADGWQGIEPHHHIVNVTVSGSWWSGQKDERGIPHSMMPDGAPNGYSTLKFDGNKYELDFKAAGRSSDYQMEIAIENEFKKEDLPQAELWVNVFNGSEKSTVEMQIDGRGDWIALNKKVAVDPRFERLHQQEQTVQPKIEPALASPGTSTHLWHGMLPETLEVGTHLVTIRTVDMHKRQYRSFQVFRVVK